MWHLQVLRRDAVPATDPPEPPWHRLPELVVPSGAAAVALHLLLADAPRLDAPLAAALPPSAPAPASTQLRQRPAPVADAWARLGWQQAPALTEPARELAPLAPPPPLPQQQPAGGAAPSKPFVLDGATASSLAVCMVVAALANSAGVGGGAFIVPLLYMGLGFGIKDSTALSQAAIAGGALGAVACTARERHPLDAARPLIDWRLALVLTPTLLLGCTTGVLLNQLLPTWGVTFLLIPLLAALTWRTGAAAARLHRAESAASAAAAAAAAAAAESAASAASPGLPEKLSDLAAPPGEPPCVDCAFPYYHAAELLALWAVLLGFQVGKHQFEPGSLGFAAVYAAQAATALSASAFFVAAARRQPEGGSDCGCGAAADGSSPGVDPLLLEAAGSDSSGWSTQQLASSSAVALAGGMVAGMLGIGGGMVVGPLMLELGVHPRVSAATASAMVLFSASSAAASFALAGRLNVPYAAAFSAACAVAAYLGVSLVGTAVKRSGRASLVAVLLTGIIGTGCLLTAIYSGADAVAELLASLQ